jgi:hypothetical protein
VIGGTRVVCCPGRVLERETVDDGTIDGGTYVVLRHFGLLCCERDGTV